MKREEKSIWKRIKKTNNCDGNPAESLFQIRSKRASQRTARKGVNTRFFGRFCRIIGKVVGRFLLQNPDIKRRIMTVSVRKMDFLSLLKL